jgi:catalase-peroxidase
MATVWRPAATAGLYEGYDRTSGTLKWTGTRADLVFGSNAELRALAEVYASDDGQETFVRPIDLCVVKAFSPELVRPG